MHPETASGTSATLIGRLRDPHDRDAWNTFVGRYRERVYAWCLRWGLQEHDAQDVTQSLLLAIPQKVRTYDPAPQAPGAPPRRFRSWLRAVVRNALVDFVRSQQRAGRGSGDSAVARQLEAAEAQRDLLERLSDLFDLELLEEAMARVKARVQPNTWEAFRLVALEGRTGREAAEALSMPVAHVHVHKGRVQAQIQEELKSMEGEDGED